MTGTRTLTLFALIPLLVLAQSEAPKPSALPREVVVAVKRAVEALRNAQRSDGCWGNYGPGSTALAGLAMLEAGMSVDDPVIRAAAGFVRYHALVSTNTYCIALGVVFLDRCGDKDDKEIIGILAERLVRGQKPDGGWSYHCDLGDTRGIEKKLPIPGTTPGRDEYPLERMDLKSHEVAFTDNSNTQFAILGLWVAHRHGIGVEAALQKVEERFRKSAKKMPIGLAWAYTMDDQHGMSGARTCAGLLGLAMHVGLKVERSMKSADDAADPSTPPPAAKAALNDPMIRDALKYTAATYRAECAKVAEAASVPDYYFLWSLERVAMAFNLKQLEGLDWYLLGCRRILPLQTPAGFWTGIYGNEIDTSLALLFLCRSNFTKELTDVFGGKAELKTDEAKKSAPEMKTDPATVSPASQVKRLVEELTKAAPEKQIAMLDQYRDARGVDYTDAISQAIPQLNEDIKKKARECLAARLARMTTNTLRDRLKDPDTELRRAAAIACAMKEDKTLIGDLIKTLDDAEPWVVRAAGVALARLTGQDFGPKPEATPTERAAAVKTWKDWWQKQATAKPSSSK